jgi:hypothetical protein
MSQGILYALQCTGEKVAVVEKCAGKANFPELHSVPSERNSCINGQWLHMQLLSRTCTNGYELGVYNITPILSCDAQEKSHMFSKYPQSSVLILSSLKTPR